MADIYALLVGIDRYAAPLVPDLAGCKADVADMKAFLGQRHREDTKVDIVELLDEQATGTAIVDGFRSHLAKAGPGDTALFWFSGHGSEDPVPEAFWRLDKGSRLQTLVCADSRVDGRPELLDKELALLLDEVAESGCHVLAILDSCHSGGATRGEDVNLRGVDRLADRPAGRLLPDLIERYAGGPPLDRHVLLAACQPEEKAGEERLGDAIRGRFSWALLRAMRRAGPGTTYRDLVALARNDVERLSATQRPMIEPAGPGPADGTLLGDGTITAPREITLRYGGDGWVVDAGLAHGIDGTGTRLAVDGSDRPRELRVTVVQVGRSLVEPVGWQPDVDRVYPVVVRRPARPVLFGGVPGEDDAFVRFVDPADAELVFTPEPDGVLLADHQDGVIARLDAVPDPAGLRHVARWWRVRRLRNDDSRIAYGAVLEVVKPLDGETLLPRDRPAEIPEPGGTLRLSYQRRDAAWQPPTRFLRLRNTTDQALYCVVLDLTERFKIDGELCRSARIEPGATAPLNEGELVEFFLPEDLETTTGVTYRDWLMLVVSTDEISAAPYEMPALDRTRREVGRQRSAAPVPGDWWTTTLPIVITGPVETL